MYRLFLFILSITAFKLSAQNVRNYGEITRDEILMESYPLDSSTKAVILYDFGETIFNSSGITFYTHRIVKIFDDDAFDLANIIIPYPKGTSLRGLEAITYNYENDEILQSSIDKKHVFTTLEIDGVSSKKFALPDVRPGSIIEYQYKAQLGSYIFLNDWRFQSQYPTRISEYRVSIPEELKYKVLVKGFQSVSEIEDKKFDYHFIAKNIPAFEEESYMSSTKNYLSSVSFELQSTSYQSFYSTYEEISESLLENVFFGGKLDNTRFLKNEVELIVSSYNTREEQARAIYDFVIKNTNFNNQHSFLSYMDFKKVIDGERASSADINLLLISLYKTAGIDAWPVIISTRDNGTVHPVYPLINEYNHVICQVDLGDKLILVDASDKYLPFKDLPDKDLNGRGRLISNVSTKWIDLLGNSYRTTNISGDFILEENGLLEGTLQHKLSGSAAADMREEMDKIGKNRIIDEIEEIDGWETFDIKFEFEKDIYNPLIRRIDLAIANKTEVIQDKIYISPILSNQLIDNPFKLKERNYPIDFTSPIEESMVFNISLPDNYVVKYLPDEIRIDLPNNAGSFTYSVTEKYNTISVELNFKIDQVIFDSKDYQIIKDYYDQIISVQGKSILIQKST